MKNAANTIVSELMKFVPQPFSLGFSNGIKTQINSKGVKFKTPFFLPPIKPFIDFKILVNDSQMFTGKMKFMITTEITPMGFEVRPISENKLNPSGILKASFSLSLIQSAALGFAYDAPIFLAGKSFDIDFSKHSLVI